MKKIFQIALFALLFTSFSSAQSSITLLISDSAVSAPLGDAKAELVGSSKTKYSDDNGKIIFENLPEGNYLCRVTHQNYFSKEVYVSVYSQPVFVNIFLTEFESATDTIDVRAKYYKRDETVSTSYTNTFAEEIRKTPGSGEDIIRFFESSPGVSIGWDIYNDIIARGGSPVENLTILDGFEIQNPNHYGTPGSTNGILSFINLKLVKEVGFYIGGFPPKYGGRISSVMDIKLKDEQFKRHSRDVYVSMTGFGAFFEGPVNSKSSYMFSARRSYLELIQDQLDMPLLPEYWDFNLKLNYKFSKSEKISCLGLFALDNAFPFYKNKDFWEDTVRIKLLATGVSYEKLGNVINLRLTSGYNWNYYKVIYGDYNLDINDNELYLKQEADIKLKKDLTLSLYAAQKYIFSDYKIYHGDGFNSSNYYTPYLNFNVDIKSYKLAAGTNLTFTTAGRRLTFNFGLRFDKFGYMDEDFTIAPRLGLSYKLTNKVFINASYDACYQSPELLWATANESNQHLKSIKADSYILGVEHFFRSDLRLNIEAYLKQYHFYPVSVYDPNFIYINSGVDLYPNFLDEAVSSGKGFYGGVDVTFEKKNPTHGLYWTVVYSFSKSKFLALAGDIQAAAFDYNHQLTAIIGIKLKSKWSFSTRFKYTGGRPYTPFDTELSKTFNRGIFDKTRYNKEKLPEYIRLDLRVDKQFEFGTNNLLAYIEVENVFNRENIFNYYWSHTEHRQKANPHWPLIPIMGLSFQF